MANEKTWYSWTDYSLPDVSAVANMLKSLVWCMKAALKGDISTASVGPEGTAPSSSNWAVVASCDGTTAARDGVDRWTTTFDITKLVSVTASGVHSWIELRNTTLGYSLLIDLICPVAQQCTMVLAKTAFTGGTTSARPTSVDEVNWPGIPMVDSSVSSPAWSSGARLHKCIDASGNFWCFLSRNGSGAITGAYGIQTLKNLRMSSDAWPVVGLFHFNTSGAMKDSNNDFIRGSSSVILRGRGYDGAAIANMTVIALQYGAASTLYSGFASAFFGDSLADIFPCTVLALTAGVFGLKGDFYDVKQVLLSTVTPGTRYPASGNIEKTVVGSCLVPLSVVPTL